MLPGTRVHVGSVAKTVLAAGELDTPVAALLGFATLRRDGARLQFPPFQSASLNLQPVGAMLFQLDGRVAPSHVLLHFRQRQAGAQRRLAQLPTAPWTTMILLWASAAAGLAGVSDVLEAGLWQLVRRRMARSSILAVPLASLLALLLPLPFFLNQSIMQLGDRTAASMLLALVTGFLPLGVACGLVAAVRRRGSAIGAADRIAWLAVFQWLGCSPAGARCRCYSGAEFFRPDRCFDIS